jgi:serine/threonine protein kinase
VLKRGELVGRYEIVDMLDKGGMAEVYLAINNNNRLPVALKVPDKYLLTNPLAVQLFRNEGRSLIRLSHPNIVRVLSVGEQNGLPYIAMDYVEGSDLAKEIARRTIYKVEDVAQLLRPIAEALDYMHSQDLLHLDIKPGNICLAKNCSPILIDFGVAQANDSVWLETPPRTVEYLSPEEARREKATKFSDQYSLGIVAYEMLTGRPTFVEKDRRKIIEQHQFSQPPIPEEWNDALKSVFRRALEKNPNNRFPSCIEFIGELNSAGRDTAHTFILRNPGPVTVPKEDGETQEEDRADNTQEGRNNNGIIAAVIIGVIVILLIFFASKTDSPQATKQQIYHQPIERPAAKPILSYLNGLKVTKADVRFFESGIASIPFEKRQYDSRFAKSKARYINWELNLNFYTPGHKIDFDLTVVYRRSSGRVYANHLSKQYVEADWSGSFHSWGWGAANAGSWPADRYSVELFFDNKKVATGSFEIFKDVLPKPKQPKIPEYKIEQ